MSVYQEIKTFYIKTFGCQMNEHDSRRMARLLKGLGMSPARSRQEADLVIVNSCSVRAKPEHKALSEAGRYRRNQKNRHVRVILAGCVAQQGGAELIEKAPYLDAVLGPDAIGNLPDIVKRLQNNEGPITDVIEHDLDNPCFTPLTTTKHSDVSALVTIMKGCNNFCSYCIVPHVRGREVSRARDEILSEIEKLAHSGCREVTLLGQNVNSYRDPSGLGFPDLLHEIDRQGAVERIRFTTSHPKDLSNELISAVAELERVCEHVHLALQSGSASVLQRMNRGYSPDNFVDLAKKLRGAVPDISITTDIIVGFPGESDRDFEDTLDVVRRVAFDQAFSFKYSPRPKTAAAGMNDDVPERIKADRLEVLQNLLARIEAESLVRLEGKMQEVFISGPSKRDAQISSGRTRCNRVVNFENAKSARAGTLVDVQILEARGHTLWGRVPLAT
jgi:tRNA-2-methylthio-N6-dimethylallyladenosine synthase